MNKNTVNLSKTKLVKNVPLTDVPIPYYPNLDNTYIYFNSRQQKYLKVSAIYGCRSIVQFLLELILVICFSSSDALHCILGFVPDVELSCYWGLRV